MPSRENKRARGGIGEQAVAQFLEKNGYTILERNYTVRGGEIDIIAKKGEYLAFVEVKSRSENALVSGEDAVNAKKRRYIVRTARIYYEDYKEKYGEAFCRFDVASVILSGNKVKKAKYYVSAFDANGK